MLYSTEYKLNSAEIYIKKNFATPKCLFKQFQKDSKPQINFSLKKSENYK